MRETEREWESKAVRTQRVREAARAARVLGVIDGGAGSCPTVYDVTLDVVFDTT